jgi:hypothetical protein
LPEQRLNASGRPRARAALAALFFLVFLAVAVKGLWPAHQTESYQQALSERLPGAWHSVQVRYGAAAGPHPARFQVRAGLDDGPETYVFDTTACPGEEDRLVTVRLLAANGDREIGTLSFKSHTLRRVGRWSGPADGLRYRLALRADEFQRAVREVFR